MTHRFSKEILYHFNCGKCNKWWSIADYHLFSNNVPEDKEMVHILITCPHCGHKEKIKEVENEKK
jgi:DNA-directed RNA polymerase subunit RPC12/RpoP